MRISFIVLMFWNAMVQGWDKGIDVSHYQGDIDWARVRAVGIRFAVAKATEGSTFKDKKFLQNWQGMMQNGIRAAAYHYFRGNQSAASQASNIRSLLGQCGFGANDILAVDVEEGSNTQVSPEKMAETLNDLLLELKPFYKNIYIYCSPNYWENKVAWGAFDFSQYDLWIAHYSKKSSPTIPTTWKTKGFTWWQYSDKGTVDGIKGHVDLDRTK